MNGTGKARLARVMPLVLTAAVLLMAALLIWQCADIFRTGTAPENLTESGVYIHDVYSREIVSERFGRISWAAWLLAAAIAAVLIVRKPVGKAALGIPTENRLYLACSRAQQTDDMRACEKKRHLIQGIAACVCLFSAAMIARYILTPGRFESTDLETVVGALVLSILPWCALGMAALMISAQACHKSMLRQIELAKAAPRKAAQSVKPSGKGAHIKNAARIVLLCAAIALIVLGVNNGGMFDVLVKAINICTECIGLG